MIIKIVKIYLGLSLVLWAVWGQFIFGQFLGLAYISQDLQAPSYVVGTNYRVLICCTCHFQGGSLSFSFCCLLVSSVSDFRPDTRWAVVDTFFFFLGSVVQSCCGEGGMLQTNNTGVCSQCLSHIRFRHSGSPQRRRLCWACVLCPSQLQAAQVMRCLASAVTATYRLSHLCRLVFLVYNRRTFSGR